MKKGDICGSYIPRFWSNEESISDSDEELADDLQISDHDSGTKPQHSDVYKNVNSLIFWKVGVGTNKLEKNITAVGTIKNLTVHY